MAIAIRATFYRLEQTGNNTFALSNAFQDVVPVVDIGDIIPVNTLGGQDVGGFPYLYSKLVRSQPGLNQELFAMQTVLQLETLMNA